MAENEDNNPPPQQQPHLKIPAFWSSNPEAWFGMVEGQFVLKGVTQDTMKFYHVLQSLTETAVRCLGDLMRGPPPAGYLLPCCGIGHLSNPQQLN
jgi:hypothetical protein